MAQTTTNVNKRSSVKPVDDTLSLKYIAGIIFGNKLIIGISLIIALALAIAYLQRTPPTYSRFTTILVKENKKSSVKNIGEQLADLGLGTMTSTVDNEMEEFKSPYLMYMAIKKLNLQTHYTEKHLLRTSDLYDKTPLTVSFPDAMDENTMSFDVKILGNNDYEISNMVWLDTTSGQAMAKKDATIKVKAFACTTTPMGKLIVQPSAKANTTDKGRTIRVIRENPNDMADVLAAKLNVDLTNKQATVFNMTFTDECYKRAEHLLGELVTIYIDDRHEESLMNAKATSRFIDGRLEILESELGNIDNDIESYKSEELVTNVGMEGMSDVNEQKQYSSKSVIAQNQLEIAKYIKGCLSDTSINDQLLPTNVGIEDASLNSQVQSYNEMVLRRQRLIANSSTRNPLVKEIDQTLKQLRGSISSTLVNIIHTNNMTVDALRRKEAQINSRIARNPKQEKYLQTIGRQQKIKETLYLFLLQKREENELSGNMEVSNLRVITPPRGQKRPISPQKAKVLLIALLAGIGLPTFIIWLLLTLDGTVRGKKDISGLTIPYLGTIPLGAKIKDKTKKTMPVRIMVEDKNRNAVNEAFRVMRTNFNFMAGHDTELVLFTSFFPNSGKTFVSTNLAVSLALMGKHILLVDMDLRKAELSKNLCNKRIGVSSILNGDKDTLQSCICKSEINANIDILPSGVIPPNPAELLQGERMDQLMKELRGKYDYVFIDGTPLNLVADASIVGKYADLVLFVMREGQFMKDALPDLEELYQSGNFKRMATILNGSINDGSYGSYHRYGSYGYGHYGSYGKYGYSTYGEKNK